VIRGVAVRVYVESYGCTQNLGEGHRIQRDLHDAGFALADRPEAADAGVLVTCGVIGPTEARMVRRWRAMARTLPQVVVTGCLVPLREQLFDGPERQRTRLVPIREQRSIPGLLHAPEERVETAPPGSTGPEAQTPAVREIVLAQGCTSHCTYCFSRLARGRLSSRPLPELRGLVAAAVADGAVEIRLSSLDTSCWGLDLDGRPRLPDLLRSLGARAARYRVRVGMMSPQTLAPIADAYFDALAEAPAFGYLHLPIQSGSDAVLREMRRGYDVATVRRLVASARRRIPELMLATDVIVGFPTERPADLEATVDLVEELAPEVVNVTRFSPRPMTPAALLPPIASAEVKRRSRRLTESRLRLARRRLERWIGRTETAWVVEPGSGGSQIARLENYLPVVLDGRRPLGRRIEVRIDGARSTYLVGRERASGGPPTPPDAINTGPGPF